MSYKNIPEEELKNKIAKDIFWQFDCTKIIGKVDFCVKPITTKAELFDSQSLLWAEAKKNTADLYNSISQLILTIGKARTFDNHLPPPFLGAFDSEKIAFVPYDQIADIFYMNDFNWNVAASDYSTREFKLVHEKVSAILDKNSFTFYYDEDEKQLGRFIRLNFLEGKHGVTKIKIDKNNFMVIYNKWVNEVKNSILVNWDKAKQSGIIDGDFYLADILSEDNKTLKDKLHVLLIKDHYELDRKIDESGFSSIKSVGFRDEQTAHTQFWNKYQRPPLEEYWEYIVSRRDLLVPQDIRERKGSFYTPLIWVELSQKYIADVLGEDWQDEYYVWDCAAGTGNLLTGLTNKYHIWASTLDQQDVDVMHDRIDNGANLLKSHVFQFDFLNDDFTKLPDELQKIINDPEKRKKLVIYINPPYAETATNLTSNKDRINKRGVSFTKIQLKYSNKIGIATKELFAQFLIRIAIEIPNSVIANFSKLKYIQGPNFNKFRDFFKVKYEKGFVVPANTFDNVKGNFPIGFCIWKVEENKEFSFIECDIFDENCNFIKSKKFYTFDNDLFITDWYRNYHNRIVDTSNIGSIGLYGSDFQHNNFIRITSCINHPNRWTFINLYNIIETSIYFTLRNIFESNWVNDRDQYLYPNDKWKNDIEFQNDCFTFTLFDSQNRITSSEGTNHWIPFTEQEIDAKEKFESNFMTDFIAGKIKPEKSDDLFSEQKEAKPLEFSAEAKAVFDAGRELWRYYHQSSPPLGEDLGGVSQGNYNPNASLYDIREHFQGRNEAGRMNSKSDDEQYMRLIQDLRSKLKTLAKKIEPKVYEYGFLKR